MDSKLKAWFVLCLFLMVEISCWAETTYKLQQVSSVAAGEKYVFVQDTHAMGATINNYTLQTISDYNTNGLIGSEPYVWTLETATGGFYMKNESLVDKPYLKNASGSTNLSFCSCSSLQTPSVWKFNFENRDAVLITSDSRYLGYTGANSYAYKAYAEANGHPHEIRVYQLVEESAVATKYTVTFDIGLNGTFATDETFTNQNQRVEATAGAGIILPNVKANDGYTFKGWATSLGATIVDAGEAGANYKPTADCTLYAIYAPLYTYDFYVNGISVCAGSVEQGASIPVPTTPEDPFGKKFVGWCTTPIEGISNVSPDLVTPATTMGTADLTYYAVFATVKGTGIYTESLTDDEMAAPNTKGNTQGYTDNERTYKVGNITWSAKCQTVIGSTYLQIRQNDVLSYIKIVAPYRIRQVDFSVKNGSGGVYGNTVYLVTEPHSTSRTYSVGSDNSFDNGIASITPNGDYSTLYIQAGAPCQVSNITVTYGGDTTYSEYCTNLSTLDIIFDESDDEIVQVNDVYRNVEVKRTLKAGNWNTFCVPFDMTADEIADNLGTEAEVKQLNGLDVNGEEFNMHFVTTTNIEAGIPYMVRVQSAVSTIHVMNKMVDTTESDPSATVVDGLGNSLTFHGNYAQMSAPHDSFIISNNLFYIVNSTVAVKGFRGYITTEGATGEPQTRTLNYSFDSSNVTEINKQTLQQYNRIFDSQGRMHNKLQRGVNIVNGHKIIK